MEGSGRSIIDDSTLYLCGCAEKWLKGKVHTCTGTESLYRAVRPRGGVDV